MDFSNISLNGPQLESVMYTEGPLLILAGAGSGKTRVLTYRIAHLIDDCGVKPHNILAITFTNKAAKSMRDRVDSIVGGAAQNVWVSTFHSMCVRMLRRFGTMLGYTDTFSIYDSDDVKIVMRDLLKELNIDSKYVKEKAAMGTISAWKNTLTEPEDVVIQDNSFYEQQVLRVYRAYKEYMLKTNAMDFDDLIMNTVKLFKEHPDALDYWQNRFKYIMVDEYQDTNIAQFELVRLLAQKNRNLCVVGDDDQSIYKFRGADIHNILQFEDNYPDAKVVRLEQNYRSTQKILDIANAVITNNKERKVKKLWSDNHEDIAVNYMRYAGGNDEAVGVVSHIRRMHEKGIDYKDMAVLYRTNLQSRVFEEKLIQANIPYKIYGGINFYARKEIKDVLAYLKMFGNSSDDLSIKRIINIPKRGIGDTTVAKLVEFANEQNCSIIEAIDNPFLTASLGKSAAKVASFAESMREFDPSAIKSIKDFTSDIIEKIGYKDYLKTECETTEEYVERMDNINEFLSKAADYDANTENPNLAEFLQEISLLSDIDNLGSTDTVNLMTIHGSKGLEFKVVFLVGLEEGLFPHVRSLYSDDTTDIEEERRLFYVGVTRAMTYLYMSNAKERVNKGQFIRTEVSRFVDEVPPDMLGISHDFLKNNDVMKAMASSPKVSATKKKSPMKTLANPYQLGKNVKADSLDYGVGDRVAHVKFGMGTVKEIIERPKDFEVGVQFDEAGYKKMFAGFAKLKKI